MWRAWTVHKIPGPWLSGLVGAGTTRKHRSHGRGCPRQKERGGNSPYLLPFLLGPPFGLISRHQLGRDGKWLAFPCSVSADDSRGKAMPVSCKWWNPASSEAVFRGKIFLVTLQLTWLSPLPVLRQGSWNWNHWEGLSQEVWDSFHHDCPKICSGVSDPGMKGLQA